MNPEKRRQLIERAWSEYKVRFPAGFLRSEMFCNDRKKRIGFAFFILKMVIVEFWQKLKIALKGK